MAGDQGQRRFRARRGLTFAALALLAGACSRPFHVSGTITLAAHLRNKAPRENSVLFIIAKNKGGVPVAVRRIVNPQFPIYYTLTSDDLLVPGSRHYEELILQVEVNSHGDAGAPKKGDLEGVHPEPVSSGDNDVHIVIDRQA